jgi:predicted TIM-barrel fold metal-dependent hydrolase
MSIRETTSLHAESENRETVGFMLKEGAMRRTIALEEHMLPKDVMSDIGVDSSIVLKEADALDDLNEGRLAAMDAAGIDIQVISAIGNYVQGLEPDRSLAVSRDLNDRMAATVAADPARFRAFATLPMCDPPASAAELTRAVEDLGFVGTMIHGQTNGVFLDDPSVRPVLATAERLGVPIYLHPAPPPPSVMKAYFSGLDPAVAGSLSTAGWGWHAECGLHVLRMVVNGVFERFPGLQLIIGHMGEMLPFSLARADEWLTPVTTGLSATVADTVHDHVHVTICGYTTTPPLLCALTVLGVDRILFAVDYPFSNSSHTTAFLRDSPLSPADKEKIGHGNAERLLKL